MRRRAFLASGLAALGTLAVAGCGRAAPAAGGRKSVPHRPPRPSPTPVLQPTMAGRPVKGLCDNPAYQWWELPDAPEPDSWWGDQQTPETLRQQAALMQQLGVRLFRVGVIWPFVAPDMPGGSSYDSTLARDPNWPGYRWQRWDQIVEVASAAGIELVPVVDLTPTWASGVATTTTAGPNAPPLSASYYGDFMLALATRYRGRIRYWELGNEPDDLHSWSGTIQQHVDLRMKPGYAAVKSVDPRAQVILGGLALSTHMDAVYAAGGGGYFDVGNVHAYYIAAAADGTALQQVRGAMNANGDAAKPLWLTEFGYATHASTTTPDEPAPSAKLEQDQADLIGGVFGITIQAAFFYQLHDTNVYGAGGQLVKRVFWGLVSRDLSRQKPGFAAFQAAVGGPPPVSLGGS